MSEPAAASHSAAPSTDSPGLLRELRLVDSTTLVIGSMIGSGIFIVSADAARLLSSPGLLIVVWVLTAVLTVIGALCYGELAASMPQAGGPYVYLREAFGPVLGFLYGWTTFLVIQTGSIAAVAVAFAKFLGILVPSISSSRAVFPGVSSEQLTAILSIALLTLLNCFGIRLGAWVQNIFTFTKTAALLALGAARLFSWKQLPGVRGQLRRFLEECRLEPGHDDAAGRGNGGAAVCLRCLVRRHLHRCGDKKILAATCLCR